MSGPRQDGMFNDEAELEMFDMVATDIGNIVQVHGKLWKLRAGASVDPVHTDLTQERYRGPFEVIMSADQGFEKTLSVDADTGLEATRESEVWITRSECERVGYGEPRTGDVLAIILERLPEPYYFYIQKAEQEGRLPQGRAFVMYRLEIRTMSKKDPMDVVENGDTCYRGRRID